MRERGCRIQRDQTRRIDGAARDPPGVSRAHCGRDQHRGREQAQAEPQALCANTEVDLNEAHIGRQVVLQFAINCAERPIIMGMLRDRETLNHRISLHVAKTGFQLSIVW